MSAVTLKDHNCGSVTVVIPTLNAGKQFSALLDAIGCQTIRPQTTIVIDSGSTDGTAAIAESHRCKVLRIQRREFDHGTTRNLAASHAETEFIVFFTQDVIPADDSMIEELISPMLGNSNIAVSYGRQLAAPGVSPLEWCVRELNYPSHSLLKNQSDISTLGLKTFFCSNCCSAIRRSVFTSLGGFKNNVIVNEDMLFAATAILNGYSVRYSAEARVYHSHSHSLAWIFRRYFAIGRFFADNRAVFKDLGLGRYGGETFKSSVANLRRNGKTHYIPLLLTEFVVKAMACKLGWYYQILRGPSSGRPGL